MLRAMAVKKRTVLLISGCLVSAGVVVFGIFWFAGRVKTNLQELPSGQAEQAPSEPELLVSEVVTGLNHPWDVAFPTSETMFYTQRGGELRGRMLTTGEDWQLVIPENIVAEGEGGLLGMTLDSSFADNNYLYICHNAQISNSLAVRVVRYVVSKDLRSVSEPLAIIPEISSRGGRHSGCRLAMDKSGVLWVGTGDSAIGTAPQDPKSLAGKVLRVSREGQAASGNLASPFDPRIYSYGHRNVQGIVLLSKPLANGAVGYSVEQGTDRDDELNYLLPGNFGYDPNNGRGGYNENASMTDLSKYPDAVSAVWSTGDHTLALSGAEILSQSDWQLWQGRILMAALKAQQGVLIELDETGVYKAEKILFEGDYGRLRTFVEAPDGSLYILTDNGSNQDKILKAEPVCTVCN